jgi:hypothetical protein
MGRKKHQQLRPDLTNDLGANESRQPHGPRAAEGKLCPQGWTLTPFPGPQFRDVAESGSAEASYYTWVDQQNTPASAITFRSRPVLAAIRDRSTPFAL